MNGPLSFNPTELDQALYHATDMTDRCLMPMVLWDQTAHSVKERGLPEGDGIYLAVRQADLAEYVVSTLWTLAAGQDINYGIHNFCETPDSFSWSYHGVPIKLQVLASDNRYLTNPDFVWYKAEQYRIPNPFADYWQTRSLS